MSTKRKSTSTTTTTTRNARYGATNIAKVPARLRGTQPGDNDENQPPIATPARKITGNRQATTPSTTASPMGDHNANVIANLLARMDGLEKKLTSSEEENRSLRAQIEGNDDMTSSAPAMEVDEDETPLPLENKIAELTKQLEDANLANRNLMQQLQDVEAGSVTSDESDKSTVPRPRGTAGQDWSLQVEMGLAGSEKKHNIYLALLRNVKDLALAGQLKWELAWGDIGAADKVKVYQLAREKHPFLKRFQNDWATEEIIKQFFKNKRKTAYARGWLDVPERFSHLKANSDKRSSSGSRTKKAKAVLAAKKARKASKKRQGKGKQKEARSADDEEEEEEDDAEEEGDASMDTE